MRLPLRVNRAALVKVGCAVCGDTCAAGSCYKGDLDDARWPRAKLQEASVFREPLGATGEWNSIGRQQLNGILTTVQLDTIA